MNNASLKWLTAIAMISVIIASGVVTIKTLTIDKGGTVIVNPKTDVRSDKPIAVELKVDERSKPKFSEPIIVDRQDSLQPRYVPVNQPEYLQNIRMEGKTYHSTVLGKIAGRASKKDWGIRGSACFTYVYGVESIGKIVKNDGIDIIEEREFGNVIEDVIVGSYEVGFELPNAIQDGFKFLCSAVGTYFGGNEGAVTGWQVGESVNKAIGEIKIPFTDKMFADLRARGMLPEGLDPNRVKHEMMMLSKLKDGKILEGKKMRIFFSDGQGVTKIEPQGCVLSQQEIDVVKRTNFVMDHYLFPDQQVAPGATWNVGGDVFAGFLDPRLLGSVGGEVLITRISDFIDARNETSKRLKLLNGQISFTDNSAAGKSITGQLSGIRGVCSIPNKWGVVTSARMRGSMTYKNVSTDHLLFEASMSVTPKFDIKYECVVE